MFPSSSSAFSSPVISPLPPHFVFHPSPTFSSPPSHLPRLSSHSPTITSPSSYFIHPLHSPYFPSPPLSSPLLILVITHLLIYLLPFFPYHPLLALPSPLQLTSLSSHYLIFVRPLALSIHLPVVFLLLFDQLFLLLPALLGLLVCILVFILFFSFSSFSSSCISSAFSCDSYSL